MRNLFLLAMLFFAVSCGSGDNSGTSSTGTDTSTKKGNSAGSNIMEVDKIHMDTGSQNISSDTAH